MRYLFESFLAPEKMLMGTLVVSISTYGFIFTGKNLLRYHRRTPSLKRKNIKRQNSLKSFDLNKYQPYLSFCIVIASGYLILNNIYSVTILLLSILIPVLLILIHASLRLRNLKNKISNKFENVGLKKTPMGLILNVFDYEKDDPFY